MAPCIQWILVSFGPCIDSWLGSLGGQQFRRDVVRSIFNCLNYGIGRLQELEIVLLFGDVGDLEVASRRSCVKSF